MAKQIKLKIKNTVEPDETKVAVKTTESTPGGYKIDNPEFRGMRLKITQSRLKLKKSNPDKYSGILE